MFEILLASGLIGIPTLIAWAMARFYDLEIDE